MLVHPLVVHFPVALWTVSLLFDALALGRPDDPLYRRAACWLVGLGLVGAALSITAGWIDLLGYEQNGIEPGIARRHWVHSLVAYAATAAYLSSFVWRWRTGTRVTGALLVLSLVGTSLIAAAAFAGGQLRSAM
jgi:uncharacterized membrane protein